MDQPDRARTTQWMFQYNPEIYDPEGWVKQRLIDDWTMYRHRDLVRVGQRIYFMRSGGQTAGIMAVGRVGSLVYEKPEEADRHSRYWIDIVYDQFVVPPLMRPEMLQDPVLRDYKPYALGLHFSAFPLPPEVAARTEELVRGRLRPIRESDARTAKRIFVSHSHEDDAFGVRLVSDLRRELGGGEDAVWYDSSGGLRGGDAWWAEIRRQVEARHIFVVILSPAAMQSKWVSDEVDMAWRLLHSKQRTRIIPVLYRPCTPRLDLQIIQQISFLEPTSYEAAFRDLMAAINLTD